MSEETQDAKQNQAAKTQAQSAASALSADFKTEQETILKLLREPAAHGAAQPFLFENLESYLQISTPHKIKKEKIWRQQEVFCRLMATGNYLQYEAYQLSHPECKTSNLDTVYPKASRLAGRPKIQARIEELRKEAQEKALMPLTEAYYLLRKLAEKGSKEEVRRQALNDILKIHGALKDSLDVNLTKVVFDKEDKGAL
ncbi:MAG: hypothetical protein LBG46_01050 [Elusimicrobiota bacterium]|jgi:hypothetical protein|nr:hypothetical protein [Elusimicrobiota bacterium]